MGANDSKEWLDIVDLMRRDVRELGREPQHAGRFLSRVAATFEALGSQLRRSWGLTAHEWHAVVVLWDNGRMTMSQLGDRIPLSRAAVTTLSDRLQSLGLIERLADPGDRRRILLTVTPKAEAEFERVHAEWNRLAEKLATDLGEERWGVVVDALSDLRDSSKELSEQLRAEAKTKSQARAQRKPARPVAKDDLEPTWW